MCRIIPLHDFYKIMDENVFFPFVLKSCALSVNHSSNVNEEFIKYEYHIVYSHSYGVPVLYFTASQPGRFLSYERVSE